MKKIVLILLIVSSAVFSGKSQSCSLLCNGDFELPALGHWAWVGDSLVPCWQTNEWDSLIEIWPSGYYGVPAYHGQQFIEIDAKVLCIVSQNVVVAAGSHVTIGFAHRGRMGVDTMAVEMGPVGGPYVTLGIYADGTSAWGYYTINYTLPSNLGSYFSLRFHALYGAGGNPGYGNFLDDVSMSTYPGISSSISSTNGACGGNNSGSATVTATSGIPPYTYSWSPSGGSNMTASGLSSGTYICTVTDSKGCMALDTAIITTSNKLNSQVSVGNITCFGGNNGYAYDSVLAGNPPYRYLWNPSGQTNKTATGLSAGTYTVTVEDSSGCSNTAVATITQPAAIDVTIGGRRIICQGSTDTLTANITNGVAPYTYTWSSGISSTTSTAIITPLVSQTYSVTVTDANGCSGTATIFISLDPPLVISIDGATTICSGSQATLCAVVNQGSGTSYLWQPGSYITPCITVSPPVTTTYTLTVENGCGEIETATATIQVNPSPVVNFMADLYEGCTPLCIEFSDLTTISQGGLESFMWEFGNGDKLQSDNAVYCYPSAGIYNVRLTVTSDKGCSSTLEKVDLITVFSSPKAAFTFSPQPANILLPTVQFTDESTDVYGLAYWYWNFNDVSNSTSQLRNPSHTYQDTGTYCAQLAVMDNHGCVDTATNCVVIEPAFSLYIPSAFSPNGDGLNETFEAKGRYIKSFEMYIFDRWGLELYHATNIADGWNGTIHGGTIAQEDIYVYKIMVIDSQDNQHSYIGNVTLLK